MAILTQARCTLFYVRGQEYPGFLSLTGNYDGISQSGIVSFSASAVIADTPLNPTSIDTRLQSTRQVFCYGTEVEVRVQDDRGNFRRPRCIPKLFIRTVSPFNPKTRQISLELADGLGLCGSYTTDHWRKPEAEIEAGDRTTNEETQKVSYWFERWSEQGEAGGSGIIGTILSKLGLRYGGEVSGTIRTPWQVSGSLLNACGGLAFRSSQPSFLWCNSNGDVRVSRIETEPSLKFEINCNPVEFSPVSTAEPIKQLIVTAQIPVLEEIEEEAIEDLETGGRCTETEQFGPQYAYDPNAPFADSPFGSKDHLLSTERTCIWQYRDSKKTVTTRTERRGLAFPDFREDDPYIFLSGTRADMIQTYEETQWQYFDSESGRLLREETTKKECWGKVFNNWYDKHQDWHLVGAIYPTGVPRPSDFPDEAKYADFLYLSESIEKVYTYDSKGRQKKVETTVERPILAILDDYIGTYSQGPYMDFSGFAIAAQTLEQWVKFQGNESHIQTERRPMQLDSADALNKREQYLNQLPVPSTEIDAYLITVPIFGRIKPPLVGVNFIVAFASPNQVTDKHRLTLISRRTTSESSRSGLANAPATEYLPNRTDEPDPTDLDKQEWTTKAEVYRLNWNETCLNATYQPPREITDLGEVRSLSQMKRLAETVFFLRQGQSQTYELTLPLDDFWINGDFEPSFRVDYYDCCDGIWTSHLAHGIAIELTPKQNLVQLELLWLGSRVDTSGIDTNTGYSANEQGQPIYAPTGEIADPTTGWPLNSQGNPYYPPLGYEIDRVSGFPIHNGNLIDPTTGYPIDPVSGFPTIAIPVGAASQLVDPATGLFIDDETGYPIDGSGNLIDPVTGWNLDPDFHPVNPDTQVAAGWIASLPVPPVPPQPKNPSLNFTYRPAAKPRWKMHKADRLTASFDELWKAAKF